ncbi:MAG: bifunctional adenosylcobinamide kinase/adenosylcobinamide-phosphate guanylyltransferase [Dehalococcoidia bacterium]|jgi:adenosylcobinamide kinase/adenosylcobinamide-phosphate guanylyltransferase
MKSILITGGARSGKSRFAQKLASEAGGQVLFVATAEAKDEAMRLRIEAHRESRPKNWKTLEAPLGISGIIAQHIGDAAIVVIDCITVLVANILLQGRGEEAVFEEIEALIKQTEGLEATFILVTNEVGLGIVPDNELGRRYRDCLGRANQLLAGHADEVYLMVAGIPVRL